MARASVGLRCGALLLLLVLVTGLNIISLTSGWLSAVPYHDHAFLGGDGYVPHSHAGDRLTRAAAALAVIDSLVDTRAEAPPGSGVISLRSATAAEVASVAVAHAKTGTGFALPAPLERSRGYPATTTARRNGEQPAPVPPPPEKS